MKDIGYDGDGECDYVNDGGEIFGEDDVVSGTLDVDKNLISDKNSIEGRLLYSVPIARVTMERGSRRLRRQKKLKWSKNGMDKRIAWGMT